MSEMFGAEARSLLAEANEALRIWDVERARHPRKICAPEDASDMSPDQFTALLMEVPPQRRSRTQVAAAVRTALNQRFRCR